MPFLVQHSGLLVLDHVSCAAPFMHHPLVHSLVFIGQHGYPPPEVGIPVSGVIHPCEKGSGCRALQRFRGYLGPLFPANRGSCCGRRYPAHGGTARCCFGFELNNALFFFFVFVRRVGGASAVGWGARCYVVLVLLVYCLASWDISQRHRFPPLHCNALLLGGARWKLPQPGLALLLPALVQYCQYSKLAFSIQDDLRMNWCCLFVLFSFF